MHFPAFMKESGIYSSGMLKIGWALTLIFGGIALFIVVGVLTTTPISRHYDHLNCRKFGQNTGRVVKFVNYSYWSWECLTPSRDGRWIPTSQLRDVS